MGKTVKIERTDFDNGLALVVFRIKPSWRDASRNVMVCKKIGNPPIYPILTGSLAHSKTPIPVGRPIDYATNKDEAIKIAETYTSLYAEQMIGFTKKTTQFIGIVQ